MMRNPVRRGTKMSEGRFGDVKAPRGKQGRKISTPKIYNKNKKKNERQSGVKKGRAGLNTWLKTTTTARL
jgi:hypothetical protein